MCAHYGPISHTDYDTPNTRSRMPLRTLPTRPYTCTGGAYLGADIMGRIRRTVWVCPYIGTYRVWIRVSHRMPTTPWIYGDLRKAHLGPHSPQLEWGYTPCAHPAGIAPASWYLRQQGHPVAELGAYGRVSNWVCVSLLIE